MARQTTTVRDAGPDDAAELLLLWSEMARSGENSVRAQEDARQALANIAADPDRRLLVAESEDEIVAAMQISRGPISPLCLDTVLHTSFLLVRPRLRKQGYGQALMEAALAWAEEKGITEVTAITDSKIAKVNLSPGRAEVTRVYKLVLEAGANQVRIAGLPREMHRDSLR